MTDDIRACIYNLNDLFDTLSSLPGKVCGSSDLYSWVASDGPAVVWPQRLYNLAATENPEAEAEHLAEAMRSRELPGEVMLEQLPGLTDWNAALEHAGLRLHSEYPAMLVNTAECRRPPQPEAVFAPVEDEDSLRAWARLIALGWWKGAQEHVEAQTALYAPLLQGSAWPQPWLARVNGIPAGTGMLHLTPGVGGVYLIYVDPAFRRRGLGGWITGELVRQAQLLGCARAILQATAEGEPVYTRLGFRKVFAYRRYVLPQG